MNITVTVSVCERHCYCISLWTSLLLYQFVNVTVTVSVCERHCYCSSLWTSLLLYQFVNVTVTVAVCEHHCYCISLWTSLLLYQFVNVTVTVAVCERHCYCNYCHHSPCVVAVNVHSSPPVTTCHHQCQLLHGHSVSSYKWALAWCLCPHQLPAGFIFKIIDCVYTDF